MLFSQSLRHSATKQVALVNFDVELARTSSNEVCVECMRGLRGCDAKLPDAHALDHEGGTAPRHEE